MAMHVLTKVCRVSLLTAAVGAGLSLALAQPLFALSSLAYPAATSALLSYALCVICLIAFPRVPRIILVALYLLLAVAAVLYRYGATPEVNLLILGAFSGAAALLAPRQVERWRRFARASTTAVPSQRAAKRTARQGKALGSVLSA